MLTHSLNHNTKLVLQEAATAIPLICKTFGTIQSVCDIVRASPKRLAIFRGGGGADSVLLGNSCEPPVTQTPLPYPLDLQDRTFAERSE